MTRKHKRMRNVAVVITAFAVIGLGVYAHNVSKMKKQVNAQIAEQKVQLEEKNEKLHELEQQYDQMDSDEYIKKVATEQLGMVGQDTIVIDINK